jgi:NADH-quinone oxidoreductase subunit M
VDQAHVNAVPTVPDVATNKAMATIKDLTTRERVQLAPLLILIVGMGLFPKPFLDRINPTVNNLIAHIESRSDYREPQRANKAAPEATGEHSGHSSGADHGSGETK